MPSDQYIALVNIYNRYLYNNILNIKFEYANESLCLAGKS